MVFLKGNKDYPFRDSSERMLGVIAEHLGCRFVFLIPV